MSYIFGGNTGQTYESIKRQRAIADRLRAANSGQAKTAIQGVNFAARDIVAALKDRKANRDYKAGRTGFTGAMGKVMDAMFAPGTPGTPGKDAVYGDMPAADVSGHDPSVALGFGGARGPQDSPQGEDFEMGAGGPPPQRGDGYGPMPPKTGEALSMPQVQTQAAVEATAAKPNNFSPRDILGLMSHPLYSFASPEEKAFLGSVLTKAMEPPPESYQQVTGASLGYTGDQAGMLFNVAPDGKISPVIGGGTRVSVENNIPGSPPDESKLPAGYRYKRDENGNLIKGADGRYEAEAIPGGPKDTSETDAAAQENRAEGVSLILDDIDIAKRIIEGANWPTTGVAGKALSFWDESAAGAVKNRIMTIKAFNGFDELSEMRRASPTGGALGQVSEMENKLLQAVRGNLEQAQRKEDLLYNLSRLEQIYNRIVDGIPDESGRIDPDTGEVARRKYTDEEAQRELDEHKERLIAQHTGGSTENTLSQLSAEELERELQELKGTGQ